MLSEVSSLFSTVVLLSAVKLLHASWSRLDQQEGVLNSFPHLVIKLYFEQFNSRKTFEQFNSRKTFEQFYSRKTFCLSHLTHGKPAGSKDAARYHIDQLGVTIIIIFLLVIVIIISSQLLQAL